MGMAIPFHLHGSIYYNFNFSSPNNFCDYYGGFRKQLELKKFKLFFLCIMHKEEGEENDKPRVVQSKQKEIM